MKVFALSQKIENDIVIEFFDEDKTKLETVLVTPTKGREYMAVTENGETFGYRHSSVDLAKQKIVAVREYEPVWIAANHPSARQFYAAV